MSKSNQHVVRSGKNWAVKTEHSLRATKIVETQAEAIEIAKEIAKNQKSELFIHGRNGQIRERNSYGKDNFPPEG